MQGKYDWSNFKMRLQARNLSVTAWCDLHGFNLKTVSAIALGRYENFCNYGPKAKNIIETALEEGLIDEVRNAA
jgi:hypothetical protein